MHSVTGQSDMIVKQLLLDQKVTTHLRLNYDLLLNYGFLIIDSIPRGSNFPKRSSSVYIHCLSGNGAGVDSLFLVDELIMSWHLCQN